MDNALSVTSETAIAETSQSLQLGSLAYNTKRVYCHAVTHFLNWIEKIEQPAEITGDIDQALLEIATRFHATPITFDQVNAYLAHLHLKQKSPASIAAVLSAIKFLSKHTQASPLTFCWQTPR